jgi:hypothetical protein
VVEFYSSSVSKELKGEEEMGRRRLDGGNEEGGAPVRFGYSCAEEISRWRRTAWPKGWRCQWEPDVGDDALVGRTGPKDEWSGPVSVGVKER